ncbi:hypothetical protein JP75_02040 [Devosia riboflavina]|uniref:Uncharacterized protein n=1 Tax=Devosia riboflavina TaxID=46914 RepID=A0A087M7T1_9HYPH|nr:hypothetical protein [Devosia riboflavina]KFL32934.1 hypothetical protein JP75_02040 [Devosia riboflavina]
MMFTAAVAQIDKAGRGAHAYHQFAVNAREQALVDGDRAVAWVLVAYLAEAFAGRNYEEPLLEEESSVVYEWLETWARQLDATAIATFSETANAMARDIATVQASNANVRFR